MDRKRDFCGWVILAAALLLILMCACAGAPEPAPSPAEPAPALQAAPESTPESKPEPEPESAPEPEPAPEPAEKPEPLDAVELINLELDALRRLGLLMADFEVTRDDCDASFVTGGRIDADFTGVISFRNASYHPELGFFIDYDAGTGKITSMELKHTPEEGTFTAENGMYYYSRYDNFEDIVSPELTIGEYCNAWAQYWGCGSYELPQGADPESRFVDACKLDAWQDTGEGDIRDIDLRIAFYRDGQTEPEYAWLCYGAAYNFGPYIRFGDEHHGCPMG